MATEVPSQPCAREAVGCADFVLAAVHDVSAHLSSHPLTCRLHIRIGIDWDLCLRHTLHGSDGQDGGSQRNGAAMILNGIELKNEGESEPPDFPALTT